MSSEMKVFPTGLARSQNETHHPASPHEAGDTLEPDIAGWRWRADTLRP